MTSNENSRDFLYGLAILAKYRTDNFSINIIESSTVTISGLKRISKSLSEQDYSDLTFLGWDIWNHPDINEDVATAEYRELDYVDV